MCSSDLEFLLRLSNEYGTTLFLTTHSLEEADPCDRVAFIDQGAIVALGAPEDLKRTIGRESIELTAERPADLVARVRELTGAEPRVVDGRLTVIVDDAAAMLPRLLPLTEDGVELRTSRPTLEDVFVAVTSK